MNLRTSVWTLCLLIIVTAAGPDVAQADVRLPGIFSDHMVLQRDKEVAVWGFADKGETVTVSILDQKSVATAKDGMWSVRLRPMKAGGPYTMTVQGKNTIELKDICIGEVWMFAGQSNMTWRLGNSKEGKADLKAGNVGHPKLRLFVVDDNASPLESTKELGGAWTPSDRSACASFSAIGYYFGLDLAKKLDVHVGMIHASGGGIIEKWIGAGAYALCQSEANLNDLYERDHETYAAKLAQAEIAGAKMLADVQDPKKLMFAGNYNVKIHRIAPYALRGAIWYQGEGNAYRWPSYNQLLPELIRSWRRAWDDEHMPFLLVQLSPAAFVKEKLTWAGLRETQLLTHRRVSNTALIVTIDVGDESDWKELHPLTKKPIADRLALAARGMVYGEKVVYSGPVYEKMTVDGDRATLHFSSIGSGLLAKGGMLKGFEIAGQDRNFVPAVAEIKGDTVIVHAPTVTTPVAVRYAFSNSPPPDATLYNKDGLPASPFRTDNWDF